MQIWITKVSVDADAVEGGDGVEYICHTIMICTFEEGGCAVRIRGVYANCKCIASLRLSVVGVWMAAAAADDTQPLDCYSASAAHTEDCWD